MCNRYISVTSLFIILLMSNQAVHGEPKAERPCTKSDMIGVWELSVIKNKPGAEKIYPDLTAPYQLRIYKNNGEFRQGSVNNEEDRDKLFSLMQLPQNQIYTIENGVVTTYDNNGNVLEEYGCSYFYKDFPNGNIQKGTLSLLWYRNNEPFILNTYIKTKRQSNNVPQPTQ